MDSGSGSSSDDGPLARRFRRRPRRPPRCAPLLRRAPKNVRPEGLRPSGLAGITLRSRRFLYKRAPRGGTCRWRSASADGYRPACRRRRGRPTGRRASFAGRSRVAALTPSASATVTTRPIVGFAFPVSRCWIVRGSSSANSASCSWVRSRRSRIRRMFAAIDVSVRGTTRASMRRGSGSYNPINTIWFVYLVEHEVSKPLPSAPWR